MEVWGGRVIPIRNRKLYRVRKETLPCDYRNLYRFDEGNVEWIADHFLGDSWDSRGGGLSCKQQLQTFLRYMSDPGYQNGVGEDIGIDQTTVSRTVHKVKDAILGKLHLWMKFPQSKAEVLAAKQDWNLRFSIPSCIGAIDCTHIRIPKPSINGDEYINRKGYPSFNVQATCDAKECFTSIDAHWPGSVHDARIFRNSGVKVVMERLDDTILIADSGYGITRYLITPYENPQTPQQLNFNNVYAKERVIVERCFGQLKMRFPILHYKVRTKLDSVGQIVLCCAVLHNVAKYLGDANDFEELEDDEDENYTEPVGGETTLRRLGQRKRDAIARIIYSKRN